MSEKSSRRQTSRSVSSMFMQGRALHTRGDLTGALACYKKSLICEGTSPETLWYAGIVSANLSQLKEALNYFVAAEKVDGNNYKISHYRGLIHLRLAQINDAIACLRSAYLRRPDLPEIGNNLAFALYSKGEYPEAKLIYLKTLALKPAYAEAHNNLGNVYFKLGELERAAKCFETALEHNPSYFEAHANWGALLVSTGQYDEALQHYRQATKIEPNDAESIASIARILNKKLLPEDAIKHWRKSLELRPGDYHSLNHMGVALRELGDFDEAMKCFDSALKVAPQKGVTYLNIATTRQFGTDDPLFKRALALSNSPELAENERVPIDFALGRAFAKDNDFEKSFFHFARANSARRLQIEYDEPLTLGLFTRIKNIFDAECIKRFEGFGHETDRPIFVLGLPRSGTTLVEQIISSHPRVHGAGELASVGNVTGRIGHHVHEQFPEAVRMIDPEIIRTLAEGYLAEAHERAPKHASRVTDKMPTNFLMVGLISVLFPRAKIIALRRDPRDVAISAYSILFATGQSHTYNLNEMGRYINAFHDLMEHWSTLVSKHQLLEVQYEELVHAPEHLSKMIINHIGLEWDENCLSFHQNSRAVKTASTTQVRQPLYTSSIGRWKSYENQIGELLELLHGCPSSVRAMENAETVR